MEEEAAKAIERFERTPVHHRDLGSCLVEESEQKPKFLQQILESGLPAQEKSKQRIGQEVFSIIAAGGETVARTLTVATYHLLSNPSMLERLRNELRIVQSDPRGLLEVQNLEHLPWLLGHSLVRALMDEILAYQIDSF